MSKLPWDSWTGRWSSTEKHLRQPWNTYMLFRKVVQVRDDVESAIIRISADARYTLYVNARRVHHGPGRCFAQFQVYDELDLQPFLQSGDNTLCVIVHQFGVPVFFHQFRDANGLLIDGQIVCKSGAVSLHTPDGWRVKTSGAWRKTTARLSIQLGFQEHFDADKWEADWHKSEFVAADENGWKAPGWTAQAMSHPWTSMEKRSTPLLVDKVRTFAALLSQFSGESDRGYKITENVALLAKEEKRARGKKLIDNPTAMLHDDESITLIPPPSDGEFTAVVLDTGSYYTGHLMLDIAEAHGDEIIDILYSETLDKDGFVQHKAAFGPEGQADRYRCRPGAQQWEPFNMKAARYVALVFRNIEHPLHVRFVGFRQVGAGFTETGKFECSDKKLNAIWEMSRLTQLNCAFDSFVDCPSREQAQWWGDARVQARVTGFAFGDSSLLARGITMMAQGQDSTGMLHSHPPADIAHHLPDFMMTWIGTLVDHYLWTGSTALMTRHAAVMHRVLEFFKSREDESGLLGNMDDLWLFLDWVPLHKANFSAVFNLMYLQALRWATDICKLIGDEAHGKSYDNRATALQLKIESTFWNAKEKLWNDGWDPQTQKSVDVVSQHANALAILLDLRPESHEAIARSYLLKPGKSKKSKVLTASPFFYAYVLDAMVKAGLRSEAMDLLKAKWSEMLDAGSRTCWEMWDDQHSNCHAWASSPVYHLMQQVLGIMPTAPGWKKVQIDPLMLDLEFARGSVPTPLGLLHVEWERVSDDQLAVRIDVPESMEATFKSPTGEIRELQAGKNEFHT